MDEFETGIDINKILQDADLNAELAQLGWSDAPAPAVRNTAQSQPPAQMNQFSQPSKQPAPPLPPPPQLVNVDISNLGVVDESNLELTEDDFKDQSLLLEFENLNSSDTAGDFLSAAAHENGNPFGNSNDVLIPTSTMNSTNSSSAAATRTQQQQQHQHQQQLPSQTPSGQPPKSDVPTAEEAKQRAVNYRREGNTQEALKWLRYAKQVERGVDTASIVAGVEAAAQQFEQNDARPQSGSFSSVTQRTLQQYQPSGNNSSSSSSSSNSGSVGSSVVTTKTGKPSANNKSNASSSNHHSESNISRPAEASLSAATMDNNNNNSSKFDPNNVEEGEPDPRRLSGVSTLSSGSSRYTGYASTLSQQQQVQVDPFSPLEEALLEASKIALREARKHEKSDKRKAIAHMREYKAFQQDLVVLKSRRLTAGARPALFRWNVVKHKRKIENNYLAEDQIKIEIPGVFGIEALVETHSSRSISLSYSLGINREAEATVLGPVTYKDGAVEFNHDVVLPVLKRSRNAQHLYSRKKAVFDLVLHKGIFRSNEVLAQAVLPLNELLNKSRCGGELQLRAVGKENGGNEKVKKGTLLGGVLKVWFTIRSPLHEPEYEEFEERSLVLDPWPAVEPVAPAAAAAGTGTGSSTVASGSTAVGKEGSTATATATAAAEGADNNRNDKLFKLSAELSDREKTDPHAVDFIESNDVLEQEIQDITQQLQATTASSRDEDERFNLQMRLQLLQGKMQLLVYRVQSGALDLDEYLQVVRERISADQKMALYFNSLPTPTTTAAASTTTSAAAVGESSQSGGKADAIRIMKRIRIMKQEVQNAEEAQKEAAEDD